MDGGGVGKTWMPFLLVLYVGGQMTLNLCWMHGLLAPLIATMTVRETSDCYRLPCSIPELHPETHSYLTLSAVSRSQGDATGAGPAHDKDIFALPRRPVSVHHNPPSLRMICPPCPPSLALITLTT